uniref:Cytidine deaminase n=1 Tax=Romanomermis culicivorax TaxID=13658 RepID=A0A915JIY5_ROMCU
MNGVVSEEILTKLVKQAILAKEKAYAPYSNFRVGAAILCDDGTIVTGCNVENVSYGLSICAERTAVVKAVSEGKRKFLAVAVTSDSNADSTFPCGACRQFLREFGDYLFISVSRDGQKRTQSTTDQLLPHAFLPENLSTNKQKNDHKF